MGFVFKWGRALKNRFPEPARSRIVRLWLFVRDAWLRIESSFLVFAAAPGAVVRRKAEKRILGICHFREQAFFLGDMMEFLEILNVLREEHGVDKIDVCYVDDESNPNQPISLRRYQELPGYKGMAMSLRALLPSLGSVFWFDSDILFESFFRSMRRHYIPWPKFSSFHSWPSRMNYNRIPEDGTVYPNVYAPLYDFFGKHGRLPVLTCPPEDLRWARRLMEEHVKPAVPIAVQVRFNPDSSYRDSNTPIWTEFLRSMEPRSDVKFMVVCRKEEIVPEWRAFKNVLFAKDFGSTVLQDLAVIQTAYFSMFPSGGFATFPWFCGTPSVVIGEEHHAFALKRSGLKTQKDRHPFMTPFQRMRWGPYTADTILEEFDSLWGDLEKSKWENPYGRDSGLSKGSEKSGSGSR